MSMALIDLARNFLDGSLSGKSFTKKFFEMWRSEGASGLLKKDDDNLGACLRLMFGMADCFTDGPKDNDGEAKSVYGLRQFLSQSMLREQM
ncbi:hypothetical protein FV194_16175 [Pseudomonas aeruginosa]|nr:hypothetical protein [Pseudomonas aeruginosa]